jgi:hypothetical protein
MNNEKSDIPPESESRVQRLARRLVEGQDNSITLRAVEKAQAKLTQSPGPAVSQESLGPSEQAKNPNVGRDQQ